MFNHRIDGRNSWKHDNTRSERRDRSPSEPPPPSPPLLRRELLPIGATLNSVGKVTQIDNDCGVVNDEVFFSIRVCRGRLPLLGSRVKFEAHAGRSRLRRQCSWIATRIKAITRTHSSQSHRHILPRTRVKSRSRSRTRSRNRSRKCRATQSPRRGHQHLQKSEQHSEWKSQKLNRISMSERQEQKEKNSPSFNHFQECHDRTPPPPPIISEHIDVSHQEEFQQGRRKEANNFETNSPSFSYFLECHDKTPPHPPIISEHRDASHQKDFEQGRSKLEKNSASSGHFQDSHDRRTPPPPPIFSVHRVASQGKDCQQRRSNESSCSSKSYNNINNSSNTEKFDRELREFLNACDMIEENLSTLNEVNLMEARGDVPKPTEDNRSVKVRQQLTILHRALKKKECFTQQIKDEIMKLKRENEVLYRISVDMR